MPKYVVNVDVLSVSAICQPEGLGVSALTQGEVFDGEILGRELCEKLLASGKISLAPKDAPIKMETMPNSADEKEKAKTPAPSAPAQDSKK